jgi:hypothetical protein
MAYEGELMRSCPLQMFKYGRTYAVIVTGAKFNPYGHMLLNTGGPGGIYFQVAGSIIAEVRFMNEQQFQRYLSENQKTIVTVLPIHIRYPEKAQLKLEELLSKKWTWGGVFHNCESMVEAVIMAGGAPKIHRGLLSLPINGANNQCSPW